MWNKIIWLALAGAFGTIARYLFGGFVDRIYGGSFPLGTLAVNVLGCFLFGLVWHLAENRLLIRPETRFYILTGFMGAFTTFSTYAFDTTKMLKEAQWMGAVLNHAAQTCLGVGAVFLGIGLGKLL